MTIDLLSIEHGIPAWTIWGLLTALTTIHTTLAGALLLDTPLGALIPLVMLAIWWVWMLAGASAGWFPRTA